MLEIPLLYGVKHLEFEAGRGGGWLAGWTIICR